MDYRKRIASELSLDPDRVALVMELMAGGATIPFIARYRKEVSGGMDEVVLSKLRDLSQTLEAVERGGPPYFPPLKSGSSSPES